VPRAHVAELREVSPNFDKKPVLDQVSLAVDPQERLVIIGQSGSGKTTILRLILGILTTSAGAKKISSKIGADGVPRAGASVSFTTFLNTRCRHKNNNSQE
jgi:ABC-type transporter Mla maintaining outer membrane lipid asymmetry ATPase subunit MlaF